MRTPDRQKFEDDEKPLAVRRTRSGSMWCENCEQATICEWTQVKIYTNGREVEAQKCMECKAVQETEFFKGPTTRIKKK